MPWKDETGEPSGPLASIAFTLMFGGLPLLFIFLSFLTLFNRDRRIVIDKVKTGKVSVIQTRWLLKDKFETLSKQDIRAVNVIPGKSRTQDSLVILADTKSGKTKTLEVDDGKSEDLLETADVLIRYLDVESINRVGRPKDKTLENAVSFLAHNTIRILGRHTKGIVIETGLEPIIHPVQGVLQEVGSKVFVIYEYEVNGKKVRHKSSGQAVIEALTPGDQIGVYYLPFFNSIRTVVAE